MRYVKLDRVRALKALRRPSSACSEGADEWQASLVNPEGDSYSRTQTIRNESDRLARILGATKRTNQYGDYLSLRCWCAEPPQYSPDLRALKLLMPEAPHEIADPEQWLFLDTERYGCHQGARQCGSESRATRGWSKPRRSSRELVLLPEKTDLKPGMDPERAARLRQMRRIAENPDFDRGAPILSLVACEENSFRRAVASSTTSEVR